MLFGNVNFVAVIYASTLAFIAAFFGLCWDLVRNHRLDPLFLFEIQRIEDGATGLAPLDREQLQALWKEWRARFGISLFDAFPKEKLSKSSVLEIDCAGLKLRIRT